YFGYRTILIVCKHLRQNSGATGSITLVLNLFVGHSFQLAGPFLDGTVDVFARHAVGSRRYHGRAQAWVGIDVAAAHASGYGNFLDELGKKLTLAGIFPGLFILDRTPLRMTRHHSSISLLFMAKLRESLPRVNGESRLPPARCLDLTKWKKPRTVA